MSKNACVGSMVVVKFFMNERIKFRLNDKVYYTHEGEQGLWSIIYKEGKYLTLKNITTDQIVDDIKISEVIPKNNNNLITRSLGKIGVINSSYNGDQPKAEDLWLAVIVKENNPGKNIGCFILDPIKKLHPENTDRLIPGMYSEELIDKVLFIRPTKTKDKDGDPIYWILSIKHRMGLEEYMKIKNTEYYAVIVELGKKDIPISVNWD